MQSFSNHNAVTFYLPLGAPIESAPLHLVWAHGWGQDHRALVLLARGLEAMGAHTLIDFPGFGSSPAPPCHWGTADYADSVAAWLDTLAPQRRIWIGYSFGGRVGIQLAARRPDLIDGLFLISAAGLPRSRTLLQEAKFAVKVALFKSLKGVGRLGLDLGSIRSKLGSADYRTAGPLRPILVKVVGEDLSQVARQVRCPVKLLYGARDTETPPELGRRLAALIPGADFSELPRLDHYTILSTGGHQLQHQIQQFIGRISP
jgi:pimeloyl-ACP methyl ester carboxylesterase